MYKHNKQESEDQPTINQPNDHHTSLENNHHDLESQQEINKLKTSLSFYPKDINWDAIGNFSGIEYNVRHQLQKVYLLLATTIICTIIGCSLSIRYEIGTGPVFPLMSLVLVFYVAISSSLIGLLFFGLVMGIHLGPTVGFIMSEIDPLLPLYALTCTCMIFLCFSITAHWAKRRSYLYLGSTLMSCLSILTWHFIFSLIFGGFSLHQTLSLYGGLLLFSGFIIVDTQIIIERCHAGDEDTVKMALQLFLDFLNIFIRILAILAKKNRQSE